MADKYTSQMALEVSALPDDLTALLETAAHQSSLDRIAPVAGSDGEACEVSWGGRMQRAVVRMITDENAALLRTETYIGQEGFPAGLRRQAQLLDALASVSQPVHAVRDLAAHTTRDVAWLHRITAGQIALDDAITVNVGGTGVRWVYTHGAARFGVPDLELYGLTADEVAPAIAAITHVHQQLLATGIQPSFRMPTGELVHLVPVRDAWMKLPLDWPGIGRAGQVRAPGLDGPRATLSLLHPKRWGRYRQDFAGVRRVLIPR